MATLTSYRGPKEFCPGFARMSNDYNETAGLLWGCGTSSLPVTDAGVASKTFLSFYLKSTATSGTSRAMRINFTCSGSQTADCLRLVLTHTGATAVSGGTQTVHATLGFGSSAGNVAASSANAALRGQISIPNRTLTGTVAGIYSEMYSEGASSNLTANQGPAFFMAQNTGNATGIAAVSTNGFFLNLQGFTSGAGNIFRAAAPTTLAASLKCIIDGVTYYLPLYSAQA